MLSHGKSHEDWPEMVKKAAVAGQHLLSLGSEEEKVAVATTVMALLEELLMSCHFAQRPAVLLMVSYLHTQVGLVSIDGGRVAEAHDRFLLAYEISLSLAAQSGEHILEDPMSMLANTYAMQGHFDKALPLYQVASPMMCIAFTRRNLHDDRT